MTPPIEQAWDLQQRWSGAARRAHLAIDRARRTNLELLVAAAVAGAIGGVLHDHATAVRIAAIASAIALGLAGLIQQRRLGATDVGRWVAMRLTAERLKAGVWRELALDGTHGTHGTHGTGDDEEASRARIAALVDAAQAVARDYADAIIDLPATPKPLPAIHDVAGYRAARAEDQERWHRDNARTLLARARQLRTIELAVTVAGIAVSAIAGAYAHSVLTPIVSALSAIAAALAAHVSAAKHERVAAGYALTASDLARAIGTLPDAPNAEQASAFVDSVEAILDRQNTSWVSLFSGE